MASKYYILSNEQLAEHIDTLEYIPSWNVAHTQCIVEVKPTYVISNYLVKFEKANDVQDWIHSPNRIDEWYQPDESELV